MPVDIKEDILKRNFEEIKVTYELEKELAKKLKAASKEERIGSNLYSTAYDDFFSQIPLPLKAKNNPKITAGVVARWMKALNFFLYPNATFLELGAGECGLSLEVAKSVKKVYALDVSNEATKELTVPDNFELVLTEGITVPLPSNSIDIAYSHQMMEHIHPDDALEQLQNIYQTLSPGGIYICITPNRLSGPYDTSMFFDEIATGWHLKEYTVCELYNLFRKAGFSKVSYFKIRNGSNIEISLNIFTVPLLKFLESSIEKLPFSFRRKLALRLLFRGITIVGTK